MAKDLEFDTQARQRLKTGIDKLGREGHAGPEGS